MKEEHKNNLETLKKKKQIETLETERSLSQMKNIIKIHSNWLEHVEERISGSQEQWILKKKKPRRILCQ
jgi:hypothetical protein